MLQLFGFDLCVIALIGIIMLIMHRSRRTAIMMVDFALSAQRERNLASLEEAIYEASRPALPPDHDDDHVVPSWAACR